MTIQYQALIESLSNNPQSRVEFYLPNGNKVPAHFHLTDVGSVFRHFIDCGAQVRNESYVQIQLWHGTDTDHRLNSDTVLKILSHSGVVLDKLPDLQSADVILEYKDDVPSQYPIARIEQTDQVVKIHLQASETQCLAAIRHQQAGKGSCC